MSIWPPDLVLNIVLDASLIGTAWKLFSGDSSCICLRFRYFSDIWCEREVCLLAGEGCYSFDGEKRVCRFVVVIALMDFKGAVLFISSPKYSYTFYKLTTLLHVQHTFRYIWFRWLYDHDVKFPAVTFCGGRKHTKASFSLSFWTSLRPARNQLQEISPTFDILSELERKQQSLKKCKFILMVTILSPSPSSLLKLPNNLRGFRVEEKGKESRFVFYAPQPFKSQEWPTSIWVLTI